MHSKGKVIWKDAQQDVLLIKSEISIRQDVSGKITRKSRFIAGGSFAVQ